MKIMVGGTFDPLHDGHKQLISRSFELAGPDGHVVIGLTTDRFASRKIHPVRPYRERKENLVKFIVDKGFSTNWAVEPLNDRFGSAIDADFDALVVSEETLATAAEINRIRRERGKKKVDIHQITCVLAQDGRWISSTRIYRGEIDEHGTVLPKDS
jgi:pantetheine-phosphate adenylyltransferase